MEIKVVGMFILSAFIYIILGLAIATSAESYQLDIKRSSAIIFFWPIVILTLSIKGLIRIIIGKTK